MESQGFRLTYRSLADLAEDYRSHLRQGRLVLGWTERNPAIGVIVEVLVEVPGGGTYFVSGPVTRNAAGKGFAFDLGPESKAVAAEIERLVQSAPFQQALVVESPSSRGTRQVHARALADRSSSTTAAAPAPKIPASTSAIGAIPRAGGLPAPSGGLPAPKAGGLPAPSGGLPAPKAGGLPAPSGGLPAPSGDAATPPPVAAASPLAHEAAADLMDAAEGAVDGEPRDRYDDYDDDIYGEADEEGGSDQSDEDQAPSAAPGAFRAPKPGEKYPVYVAKFKTILDFLDALPAFRDQQTITLPWANETSKEGDLALLRLTLPGRNIFSIYSLIGRVRPNELVLHVNGESPTYIKAVAFPKSVVGSRRLQAEKESDRGKLEVIRVMEERPTEDEDSMPLRRRISRMSMEDKINLALSGGREERMVLAMDGNKAIHHYLLKNARLGLDEISFMARLTTMNPDVLAKIAENPAYTQNQTVVKNLVYNPKTPVTIAVRLLDRLPRSEIMSLAKRMSMNARLIQAAKKKIEGRK